MSKIVKLASFVVHFTSVHHQFTIRRSGMRGALLSGMRKVTELLEQIECLRRAIAVETAWLLPHQREPFEAAMAAAMELAVPGLWRAQEELRGMLTEVRYHNKW